MPYDDDPTAGYQPGDVPSEPTEHIKVDIPVTPPSQNYNYQQSNTKQYTEQRYTNDDYGDENVMGEFIFSVAIIAVAFIVPYIFYFLNIKQVFRENYLYFWCCRYRTTNLFICFAICDNSKFP